MGCERKSDTHGLFKKCGVLKHGRLHLKNSCYATFIIPDQPFASDILELKILD